MRRIRRACCFLLFCSTVAIGVDFPPHVIDAGGGWISCERGYVLQNHCGPSDADVVHGPTIEISTLPSAGEGAPGTCPSGGCRSAAPTRFYAPRTYTTPSGWTYIPGSGLRGGELVTSTAPMSTTRIMLPAPC